MKKVFFDTELNNKQTQVKLESIFNNEIEFENVMFVKYCDSFQLKTKQWDDPLVKFNRKKIFDFFNIEVQLTESSKGTKIEVNLKTLFISISLSSIMLTFLWSLDIFLYFKNTLAFNIFSVFSVISTLYVVYQVYQSNKQQKIVLDKIENIFSKN